MQKEDIPCPHTSGRRVLHQAKRPQPTLRIVKPAAPCRIATHVRKLLVGQFVGIDGEEGAKRALLWAGQYGKELGMQLFGRKWRLWHTRYVCGRRQ